MTKYRLYQAGTKMYENKTELEHLLYGKIGELFPQRNKIVIYDLTNMYFEGKMNKSKKQPLVGQNKKEMTED